MSRNKVKRWMQAYCQDYLYGWELNHTALAEGAANEFDIYENTVDYPIPEWVYELALEIELPDA